MKLSAAPGCARRPLSPSSGQPGGAPPLELPFILTGVELYRRAAPGLERRFTLRRARFCARQHKSGCIPSQEWVLAAAGLVIRSDNGVVLVDLDGDGIEQTGWVLMYLHIATRKTRADWARAVGLNDPIGRPSCEGGLATGNPFHFARKYNGEWILADGPLFKVSTIRRAHAGLKEYDGTLTRNGKTVTACTCGSNETKITRPLTPGP